MKPAVLVAVVLLLLPLLPAHAQEKKTWSQKDIAKLIYRDFRPVTHFGSIWVVFVAGGDAKQIGMSEDELTDLVKLRFKNAFAAVPYRAESDERIERLSFSETEGPKVGRLWCRVWVVGNDYPIAYHVQCRAGTFKEREIWADAALGYGSKQNVPASVRATLNRMLEKLAVDFFTARDEL